MTARSRAQVLDHPGLFDLPSAEPTPKAPATVAPQAKVRRRHVLDLPRKPKPGPCEPVCLVCGREEGYGLCASGCAVICEKPKPPTAQMTARVVELNVQRGMTPDEARQNAQGRSPVEVCLIRDHVTAVLTHGIPIAGRTVHQLAWVACPHCGALHWHAPAPTRAAVGQCGGTYVIHTPERTPA